MLKQATCECGWTATGTEEELIPLVQQHGREVHGLDVTPEQVVALLKPVEA
jgi:predicted small metal-binding protein